MLLPCPSILSAVHVTRTQLAALRPAQEAFSHLASTATCNQPSTLLQGCVVLLPVGCLTHEAWSVEHTRLGLQRPERISLQFTATDGQHIPDSSSNLRARVVLSVELLHTIPNLRSSPGESDCSFSGLEFLWVGVLIGCLSWYMQASFLFGWKCESVLLHCGSVVDL